MINNYFHFHNLNDDFCTIQDALHSVLMCKKKIKKLKYVYCEEDDMIVSIEMKLNCIYNELINMIEENDEIEDHESPNQV